MSFSRYQFVWIDFLQIRRTKFISMTSFQRRSIEANYLDAKPQKILKFTWYNTNALLEIFSSFEFNFILYLICRVYKLKNNLLLFEKVIYLHPEALIHFMDFFIHSNYTIINNYLSDFEYLLKIFSHQIQI